MILAVEAAAAPWALIVAIVGLITSAIVGIYTAHTARKTAREATQLAAWSAIVEALQGEVDRLHSRVTELENGNGRTR